MISRTVRPAALRGGILGKLVLVVVAVVLLAVAAVLLLANLDRLVRSGIERAGSRATGTAVTVDDVEIGLADGTGVIRGVTVANPEGFATRRAVHLGTIDVTLDTETLGSDVVVVKRVVVDGPEVTYEWDSGGSNIARIEENVERFRAELARSLGGGGGGSPSGDDDGRTRIVIEELVIQRGRIGVSASFLAGNEVSTPLPRMVLTNLGEGEGGLTPGQVAARILDALTGSILEAVAGLRIDGLADGAAGLVEDAADALKDGVEGAGKAIKDLFGGDDDE